MGGAGKNVIIRKDGHTSFTKDGVSVAKNIQLKDPIENIGATLVIEAANKTVNQCGDGTTTTSLFTNELVKELIASNIDINTILEELDLFTENLEQVLSDRSKKIETIQDIYNIALTSSKSAKIARLLRDIYEQTGNSANISLEMSKVSDNTYFELTKGLNFESGMVNSRFANEENGNCVFEDVYLMLEQDVVSVPMAYKDILDEFLNKDKAIVIIAPGFSDLFIRFAVTARMDKGLKICLITSPGYGSSIKENYKDIATFSNNGNVDKIVITNYDFTIFNQPDNARIKKRTAQLEKMIESAHEDLYIRDYTNRIVSLNQIGAMIYVGGVTEAAAREEYDRIGDSVGSIKSALRSGYVRGAGSELCQIIPLIKDFTCKNVFENVMRSPFKKIIENGNIIKEIKTDIPYNVKTKMYDENLIDSTEVLIESMKNAASVVKLLVNTSFTLYNE
jgi:chaperonin GroEL